MTPTSKPKILFVCSANKDRSRTADHYFSSVYHNYQFRSAGTNHRICRKEGTTLLTEHLLMWADQVYVMESKHYDIIAAHTEGKYQHKIAVLDIPDVYKYNDPKLIAVLKAKMAPYLK